MHNAALIYFGEATGDFLMLILTRRIGETLKIGDDVSLMVLGVQGNQVRIGADAPKHVAIHREEIYRRIQQEKLNGGQPVAQPQKAKPSTNNSHNNTSRNSYNAHSQNSYNSYNQNTSNGNFNSYGNGNSANNSYNSHSDKPFKKRDDYKKPYTPRQEYAGEQNISDENTRFYSTEGSNGNKAQKKAPNVIVKKKRVIEGI